MQLALCGGGGAVLCVVCVVCAYMVCTIDRLIDTAPIISPHLVNDIVETDWYVLIPRRGGGGVENALACKRGDVAAGQN